MKARDMLQGILGSVGLPLPKPSLFSDDHAGCSLDWYDTEEARKADSQEGPQFPALIYHLARAVPQKH
jgi:hypothetical protein